VRAYVLIQTEAESEHVAQELRAIPGIVSAEHVTGAYDAIVVARAGSMRQLSEVILPEIRNLPGVMHAIPAPLLDGATRGTTPSRDGSGAAYRAA
jgi:DNA-binding Lrp family transcriptional regulator